MAVINYYCPECGGLQDRKEGVIEGHVVLGCKACKLFWLEGDHQSCKNVNDLKRAAEAIKRHNEMMESDINDPRWTQF